MHLNIIDTWRYAKFSAEDVGDDPFLAMRELVRHVPADAITNSQVIFECDQAFMDLARSKDKDDKILTHGVRIEGPTFGGIPLVVKTFDAPIERPLANHAAGLTDELPKETRGEEKTLTTTSLHHA